MIILKDKNKNSIINIIKGTTIDNNCQNIELIELNETIIENGDYTYIPDGKNDGYNKVNITTRIPDYSVLNYDNELITNLDNQINDDLQYSIEIMENYTDDNDYSENNDLVYFPMVDTSNRTSCSSMFCNCRNLQVVPPLTISNQCISLDSMFDSCTSLKNIDVTNWDTSNVGDIGFAFSNCYLIKKINGIEKLNLSNCFYADELFKNCTNLEYVDVTNWDMNNLIGAAYMFENCCLLEEINGVKNLIRNNVNYIDGIFAYCTSLTNIDVSDWDTSNITSMNNAFNNCQNLTNIIGINKWDTSSVETLEYMFQNTYISELDLSGWNTQSIIDFSNVFSGCYFLKNLNISGWDFGNISSMPPTFFSTNIETLNLTNCNFSTFTSFAKFFNRKNELKNIIGIDTIDVSNSTTLNSMFYGCENLTNLDLNNWNTIDVKNFGGIFYGCIRLKDLNLGGQDWKNATNVLNAFYYCSSLTNFVAPNNINLGLNLSYSPNLTVDSLLSILNNLTDRTSTTSLTCTLGATNLAKLTDEQKAIATSKNWVLR